MQKALRGKERKQKQRNKKKKLIVSRFPCLCSQNKASWKGALELVWPNALLKAELKEVKIECMSFSEISKNGNSTLLWTFVPCLTILLVIFFPVNESGLTFLCLLHIYFTPLKVWLCLLCYCLLIEKN